MSIDSSYRSDGVPFPKGWQESEEEQIIFVYKNSTAQQRFEWLEAMQELLKDSFEDLSPKPPHGDAKSSD